MEDSLFPLARPPARRNRLERLGRAPLFRLAVYYLLAVGMANVLVRYFPAAREALVQPSVPALNEGLSMITGNGSSPPGADTETGATSADAPPAAPVDPWHRALVTLLVITGAIVLALPVASVYMWSKRLRFDPGLVRSIIILPIAVAGILLVVRNSLATAFSLAGIVAAVRFRNTLKDPQDAVYVFLAIAIGISAGVQALDVALVVSLVFNVMVIAMWKLRLGTRSGESYNRTGTLAIGDPALLVARTPASCRRFRRAGLERVAESGGDASSADGMLLVHFTAFDAARHAVQDTLTEATEDWRFVDVHPRGDEVKTAEYLVALAPGVTPLELMGELDEWSTHFAAAEYIPFRRVGHPGRRAPVQEPDRRSPLRGTRDGAGPRPGERE